MFLAHAGGGALRDGVLHRHVHAALGDHGRQGVGDQLLPAHRADPARRAARGRSRPRDRRDGRPSPTRAASDCSARARWARARSARTSPTPASTGACTRRSRSTSRRARSTGSRSNERGAAPDYPTVLISSAGGVPASGHRDPGCSSRARCTSSATPTPSVTLSFGELYDRHMDDVRPMDLMAKPRDPQEMRYAELTRFIRALERSGGDANLLRVERALKIAIPVTCLVIALFGAPACHEHAARRHRLRHRRQPRDHRHVPHDDPAHEGHRREGRRSARTSRPGCRTSLFAVVGLVLLIRVRT